MDTTNLQSIGDIKEGVTADDVPPWADIVSTTDDGGFICRIREVPRSQMHLLPEHVEVEQVGERESPAGDYTYPVLRKDFDSPEVLWKLENRGNGRARWNRNWQESEEEKQRRLEGERRDAVLELLADKLSTAEGGVENAVERLLDEQGFEPTPVAEENGDREVPTVEHEGFEVTMDSPGTWTMPDGSTIDGKKSDAREALEAFVQDLAQG